MKVNLLKMSFADKKKYFSEIQTKEMTKSRRIHLIIAQTKIMPEELTYLTNRIRDKRLKHQKRRIKVIIRNKNYAN